MLTNMPDRTAGFMTPGAGTKLVSSTVYETINTACRGWDLASREDAVDAINCVLCSFTAYFCGGDGVTANADIYIYIYLKFECCPHRADVVSPGVGGVEAAAVRVITRRPHIGQRQILAVRRRSRRRGPSTVQRAVIAGKWQNNVIHQIYKTDPCCEV